MLKKNWRRAPGIHFSCMCGSPGLSGELGNYCDTSTLPNHKGRYNYMQPSLFNKCSINPCCAPLVRLEAKNGTEGRKTDGNTARLYSKDAFVWLPTDTASTHVWVLPFVFVPHIHFGKAGAAYRHHGLASYVSTSCSCTLQSYIFLNISPCYYLEVWFTYLNELYKEYSGTVCACANSGYQVLLSDFCRAPGNEATLQCIVLPTVTATRFYPPIKQCQQL